MGFRASARSEQGRVSVAHELLALARDVAMWFACANAGSVNRPIPCCEHLDIAFAPCCGGHRENGLPPCTGEKDAAGAFLIHRSPAMCVYIHRRVWLTGWNGGP